MKSNFQPFPVRYSARLYMDNICLSDKDVIFNLRSNPKIIHYINRPAYTSINEAIDFIKTIDNGYMNNQWITWGLRLKQNRILIGTICLWNFDFENKIAEIGYDLVPEYQRKGYMSEAMEEIIDFGFKNLGLNTIEAFTNKKNLSSIQLLHKHKFQIQPERKDEHDEMNEIYTLNSNNYPL